MSVENLDNKKKLPITPITLLKLLREHNVSFKLFKHKPLISVNDSKSIQELIFPSNKYSVHIKNLFLRDKKKRNYLITCDQYKIINLKTLIAFPLGLLIDCFSTWVFFQELFHLFVC